MVNIGTVSGTGRIPENDKNKREDGNTLCLRRVDEASNKSIVQAINQQPRGETAVEPKGARVGARHATSNMVLNQKLRKLQAFMDGNF